MLGFSRTLRSLRADGMRTTQVVLGIALAFLAIWDLWLALARVALYEVSETARLEVERIYPVSTPIGGRVVAATLLLSRELALGDAPELPVAMQHGLSGTIEIEVERVAPAVLVARAALGVRPAP
jgi:hypothetical protein